MNTSKTASHYLGKKVTVVFDRPLGSVHPKHGFIYEVNYGYIPGTLSSDNEELDAYYLSVDEPLKTVDGVCIAYIQREHDDDDKLIVVKEGEVYTDEEIMKKIYFQEKWFKSHIIRS